MVIYVNTSGCHFEGQILVMCCERVKFRREVQRENEILRCMLDTYSIIHISDEMVAYSVVLIRMPVFSIDSSDPFLALVHISRDPEEAFLLTSVFPVRTTWCTTSQRHFLAELLFGVSPAHSIP